MSPSTQAPASLRVCLLAVLTVALLLSLSLFLFSARGALHLGVAAGSQIDPNGVASNPADPNGLTFGAGQSSDDSPLAAGSGMDGNGLATRPTVNPDGIAGCTAVDPNGGGCQAHMHGFLASGVSIDGNGLN